MKIGARIVFSDPLLKCFGDDQSLDAFIREELAAELGRQLTKALAKEKFKFDIRYSANLVDKTLDFLEPVPGYICSFAFNVEDI